ncbi:preprotein translocase subunit SecE [Glaesserella parasuis]|uniref:Protein translocase subunit SecE n=3 Tax=Glaesserella parasuis TaxID=738 RepID=A0A143CGM8_GLAPU|nr:preprotein translocase subunit SecE [Glaesserella parasuis]AGO17487.1 preprotein translocase subunit SecE [Glaesserella parasuis ZJ0906]EQA00304.1 preprotein translocase, SecE subunit [Glaesserella parasuis SW114]EQA07984.1 preprotein translocase, SecE subunit [Glaesserella parasuis H465]AMW16532.1 preprotein translocase subunit SecE [Glaesserella parasuis]ATW44187.1 preprotein translocase subunit SecE [Glaesserella parasuis D74]
MAKEIQNITLDKVEKGVKSKGINNVLWVFSISLLTIAAIGNTYFAEYFSLIVRILLLVVLCVAALGIAAMTNQGQQSIDFIKDSRQELRKIIWPNRQETTQTTLMVVAMCVVVALALWGIDSIIVLIIDFLTNLRF